MQTSFSLITLNILTWNLPSWLKIFNNTNQKWIELIISILSKMKIWIVGKPEIFESEFLLAISAQLNSKCLSRNFLKRRCMLKFKAICTEEDK